MALMVRRMMTRVKGFSAAGPALISTAFPVAMLVLAVPTARSQMSSLPDATAAVIDTAVV